MSKPKNREFAKEFTRRLIARMEELDINPRRLAKLAGMPPSSVYNFIYNIDQVPHADTVVKLANALNVTTDYLINFQV